MVKPLRVTKKSIPEQFRGMVKSSPEMLSNLETACRLSNMMKPHLKYQTNPFMTYHWHSEKNYRQWTIEPNWFYFLCPPLHHMERIHLGRYFLWLANHFCFRGSDSTRSIEISSRDKVARTLCGRRAILYPKEEEQEEIKKESIICK